MSAAPERLRVLVVEDEPVNRALLRAVLGTAANPRLGGADVREAETLSAARALVGEWRPDVVILDVRLPDGNGLELARELPPRESGNRPAVLVMSASVQPSDRDAARRSGGDAFLAKPFLPADLIAMLERLAPEGAGE